MAFRSHGLVDQRTPTLRCDVLSNIAVRGEELTDQRKEASRTLINDAVKTITELKEIPELESAVGTTGVIFRNIPGTPAFDAVAFIETLKF